MRNKSILQSPLFLALTIGMAFSSACSKKQKQEGDAAGDQAVQTQNIPAASTEAPTSQPGQKIVELGTVYFGFDSFSIDDAARGTLDANANWLKSNSSRKVQVEGHTDERGTTEYNLALGERRAASVKDYLIAHGVSAGQLSTISYGEERPIDPGHDDGSWGKNRRGEFVSGQ